MNRQSMHAKARNEALKKLIALHRDEWDELYAAERVAVGLPPQVSDGTLVQQNRMLAYRVEELQRQLIERQWTADHPSYEEMGQ